MESRKGWMQRSYARLLIDNHITDSKPEFMAKFSPQQYVNFVLRSGVDAAMVYACDHNGNCYYPTMVGHMHAGIGGRDYFGEVAALLRDAGKTVIAYYTVIFHNHSAKTHPDWQMRDRNGKPNAGRYWHSCPSARGYVDFVFRQLEEIAAYDVDGFFIDMTFWPKVCQCEACRERYRAECGEDLPQTIDWRDPAWVRYQRARERWMAAFAQEITDHLRGVRPDATVTHQFSPVIAGWFLGQSAGIAAASDYASGDFYGNKYQHRLGAKIFDAFTIERPYEFMASRCVNLKDHTSSKSEDELFLHAATTLANGGAYFFIDAINPDGTLNPEVYDLFGRLVRRLRPFKDCIQSHVPLLQAEVAVYFSMPSFANDAAKPVGLREFTESGSNMDARDNPIVEEISGTGALLNRLKIPYRIATRPEQLQGARLVIVNNSAYLTPEEVASFRSFVEAGGTLLATGMTSLYDQSGETTGDFALADLLGVTFSGHRSSSMHYLQSDQGALVSCPHSAPLVRATSATVLERLAEPDFPAGDPEHYASIHSDPPAPAGEFAGLTERAVGAGRGYYLASPLLRVQQHSQQVWAEGLLRRILPERELEVSGLPVCVEATVLRSTSCSALIFGLVNYQDELPGLPVCNEIRVSLRLPEGFVPQHVRRVADGAQLTFTIISGRVQFALPGMAEIELVEITA